jgi:copper resistance protein D
MAKVALFATALALGFLNYRAVRSWRGGRLEPVETSVPSYVQGELAIVITAVLTAASLTSQAPAVDVHGDHASAGEVAAFFAPKKPLIVPPPREALLAVSASTQDAFAVPGTLERAQNNFNHNISGLLVLAVALAALLDRFRVRAARHWPLLFLPLAAFVFVFAEPTVWPWGPEPFWATLAVPAVLQHRLAALLVVGLAIGEWRVRVGRLSATRWRFVFPVLCVVGGAMLLTHSHTVFATKSEFLIELSHAVLGFLAVMVGVGRWLELRLPHRGSHAAGVAWSMCLIGVAWVLIFYREA